MSTLVLDSAQAAVLPTVIVMMSVLLVSLTSSDEEAVKGAIAGHWAAILVLALSTWAACTAAVSAAWARRSVKANDVKTIRDATSRVLDLINDGYGLQHSASENHYARSVLCNPDDWTGGRDLLMRMDAIAVRHAETQHAISHDSMKSIRAHGVARDACYGMVASFRERNRDRDVDAAIEDLSADCRAIARGGRRDAIPLATPTARIGRIISTAERMLADHPDLVDGQGARVDDLIRIHVPRLLERHRVAAESASAKDLEAVDAQLDAGVEKVRESVQEAANAVHDDAMQALSTELRFLSLRRSTTPVLAAVS